MVFQTLWINSSFGPLVSFCKKYNTKTKKKKKKKKNENVNNN